MKFPLFKACRLPILLYFQKGDTGSNGLRGAGSAGALLPLGNPLTGYSSFYRGPPRCGCSALRRIREGTVAGTQASLLLFIRIMYTTYLNQFSTIQVDILAFFYTIGGPRNSGACTARGSARWRGVQASLL